MHATHLFAAFTLALPLLAIGQAAPTLCPGDKKLDESRIKTGRWSLEMTPMRDGQPQQTHHGEQEIRRITVTGKPAFQLVQVFNSSYGTTTDTIVVIAKGLIPVSHKSHGTHRDLELKFEGKSVTGHTIDGGTTTPIKQENAEPAFDSSTLDLIMAAAPLGNGFRVRMPMYSQEKGLVWHEVGVIGDEAVAVGSTTVPAWRVQVKTPNFDVTYLVSKQTRDALGVRSNSDNMSFKLTRKPVG